MRHPLTAPVHTFHIPVMGTGFTIDSPLRVARYGISSVVSLVDDVLIEQVRARISGEHGVPCEPIANDEDDARARRITAYLDLLDELVARQVAELQAAPFAPDSEIVRYYEMLPPSPLRARYEAMAVAPEGAGREALQAQLRTEATPGAIDVNIMSKLDRDRFSRGQLLPPQFSDAVSALRGYVRSRLRSSVVLSAGMNRRLFSCLAESDDFFPDAQGDVRKRIILKVSDYRSALVQGKLLAKLGLWVSEYRVESGLNCGGHAFGGRGELLGPILDEFKRERERLAENLRDLRRRALASLGRAAPDAAADEVEAGGLRVTVQGGIGTAEEDALLRERYGVDGTGWASPFLLVPEVVNIDPEHLRRVAAAGEEDIQLSESSPLGVPFWSLRTSASEEARRAAIAAGRPGSACPKGFLASNTEFSTTPLCTASRGYQRRKLAQIEAAALSGEEQAEQRRGVEAKACICHDLGGGAVLTHGIAPEARTAVCCGPNTAYFSHVATLREMVDHIYGRARLPLAGGRPHMLLKELSLQVDRLRAEAARRGRDLRVPTPPAPPASVVEARENLLAGIRHYHDLARGLVADRRAEFLARLDALRSELERLALEARAPGA